MGAKPRLSAGRELLPAASRTLIRRVHWGGASEGRCTGAAAASAAHGNDQSDR